MTVTSNVHDDVLPVASRAVAVTAVTPGPATVAGENVGIVPQGHTGPHHRAPYRFGVRRSGCGCMHPALKVERRLESGMSVKYVRQASRRAVTTARLKMHARQSDACVIVVGIELQHPIE